MRHLLLIIFSALLLSASFNTQAAFVVKKHNAIVAATTEVTLAKKQSLFSSVHETRHHMPESTKALLWAIGGLFIPPLGIGGVIHGNRSLRHEHQNRGLATVSLVLGWLEIIETVVTIIAFIFILSSLSLFTGTAVI